MILIGATTENPYFEVNGALISRSSIFELRPLEKTDIKELLLRAVNDTEKGLSLIHIFLAPIGGGGLITGVSTLAKMLNPKIKVIGVEPSEAASMTAALKAGEPVKLPSANTIADGTAVKEVGDKILRSEEHTSELQSQR